MHDRSHVADLPHVLAEEIRDALGRQEAPLARAAIAEHVLRQGEQRPAVEIVHGKREAALRRAGEIRVDRLLDERAQHLLLVPATDTALELEPGGRAAHATVQERMASLDPVRGEGAILLYEEIVRQVGEQIIGHRLRCRSDRAARLGIRHALEEGAQKLTHVAERLEAEQPAIEPLGVRRRTQHSGTDREVSLEDLAHRLANERGYVPKPRSGPEEPVAAVPPEHLVATGAGEGDPAAPGGRQAEPPGRDGARVRKGLVEGVGRGEDPRGGIPRTRHLHVVDAEPPGRAARALGLVDRPPAGEGEGQGLHGTVVSRDGGHEGGVDAPREEDDGPTIGPQPVPDSGAKRPQHVRILRGRVFRLRNPEAIDPQSGIDFDHLAGPDPADPQDRRPPRRHDAVAQHVDEGVEVGLRGHQSRGEQGIEGAREDEAVLKEREAERTDSERIPPQPERPAIAVEEAEGVGALDPGEPLDPVALQQRRQYLAVSRRPELLSASAKLQTEGRVVVDLPVPHQAGATRPDDRLLLAVVDEGETPGPEGDGVCPEAALRTTGAVRAARRQGVECSRDGVSAGSAGRALSPSDQAHDSAHGCLPSRPLLPLVPCPRRRRTGPPIIGTPEAPDARP